MKFNTFHSIFYIEVSKLDDIGKVYTVLESYTGTNPYILKLKNRVKAKGGSQLNSFEIRYVLANHDKEPILVNKIVKIADWWGQKQQEEQEFEFTPVKMRITWFLGQVDDIYHFYAVFRRSQERAIELFATKKAILTDFLSEPFENTEIDFSKFQSKSGKSLFPHQETAVKFLVTRKKAILADSMGFGKMEPVSALIPTPNGFKQMGDIHVGDVVFGSDGKPCNVLEVFPHKSKQIYKVEFTDGTSCRCGLEHLWIVRTGNHVRRNQGWQVLSLEDMMKTGFEWSSKTGKHAHKYQIPTASPIQYEERNHYIQPYLLGLCIGDGNLCNGGVVISIPDTEVETAERITPLIKEGYALKCDKAPSCPRYRITKIHHKQYNEYIQEIKRLGLNVHGNYKFIPDEYKFDSIENRIELLRGLMDSDGTISKTGNKMHYSTNSERLADDVCELVFSLGGIARKHSYTRVKDGKELIEFSIFIQIKVNPFHLKRKHDLYNPTNKKYCTKRIKCATPDGIEDAQCIRVDSDNHSYLTSRNYIVTHNTTSSIVASIAGGFKRVLVICPASLKKNWENELSDYVGNDEITIVEGRTWKENRYTIINYDILKNFYTLPTEMSTKSHLELNDEGDVVRVEKDVEVISRKKSVIEDAMENSQLYQSKFDLIIIDEAHKLSNTSSGFFKIVSDLVKRSKPEAIYELTGTPITNKPINFYNILKIIGAYVADDWQYYVERYCEGKKFYNKKERDARTAIFLRNKNKKSWYDLTNEEKDELNLTLDKYCKKQWSTGGASYLDDLQEAIKTYYLRRDKQDLNMVKKDVKLLKYDLSEDERAEYDKVWDEFIKDKAGKEDLKALMEGIAFRQWLANKMVPKTIELTNELLKSGEKVIIFCTFDEELNALADTYKGQCVIHNGKKTAKQKNEAVEKFQNDPECKVFIGNIISAGVGLTLIASRYVVFNSIDYVPGNCEQAEDRVHRLNQTKDCVIYYQTFKDTYMDKMFQIIHSKSNIINTIIISERDK